jgi:hypothetical protein
MSLQVGSTFPSIQAVKDAIKTVLAEAQESWKATHSDKARFNIILQGYNLRLPYSSYSVKEEWSLYYT